jgi:hypothetical protein
MKIGPSGFCIPVSNGISQRSDCPSNGARGDPDLTVLTHKHRLGQSPRSNF